MFCVVVSYRHPSEPRHLHTLVHDQLVSHTYNTYTHTHTHTHTHFTSFPPPLSLLNYFPTRLNRISPRAPCPTPCSTPCSHTPSRTLIDASKALCSHTLSHTLIDASKVLGAGEFGEVWLAEQTNVLVKRGSTEMMSKKRAVKMLKAGASAEAKEEYLRECRMLLRTSGVAVPSTDSPSGSPAPGRASRTSIGSGPTSPSSPTSRMRSDSALCSIFLLAFLAHSFFAVANQGVG